MIPCLKQSDARWAAKKLVPSNLTVARFGCLLTSMCMLSDFYKEFTTPDQAINTKVFFNADGMVDWGRLNWANFKLERRIRIHDPAAIVESLKHPLKSVCLNVNNGGHWVVGLAKIAGYYKIIDPWTGKKRWIREKEVVGSANFARKV